MDIFTISFFPSLVMTVFFFTLSLGVSISHKYRSKELELKKIKVCFVTSAIFFIISINSMFISIKYSDEITWIALIILLIITRLIAKDYDREVENKIKQEIKAEEIREYNRKRKQESDTTTEENITPGKRRTTAQLKQSAFELDERVRKKLEQQAEKHGTMKKCENPSRDVTIPDNVSIGKDGLPYIKTREFGYGKRFNAFITKNSDCYHRSKCPTIRFRKKTVMHRYTAMKIYKPCARCKPIDYIDNWYQVYLKQKK